MRQISMNNNYKYQAFIEYVLTNQLGIIEQDVDLKKYCTIKIGGRGFCLYQPNNIKNLHQAFEYLLKHKLKYFLIGNGSNLLISDKYHQIIFINLKLLKHIEIEPNDLVLESGVSIAMISKKMSSLGYTGLEFLSGIPGTVGGAIYMNAGAYGYDMSDILESITYLDELGNICEMTNVKDFGFSYRISPFQTQNAIIIACKIKIKKADNQELPYQIYMENLKRKIATQPINALSAGCAFKNPIEQPAWKLIKGIYHNQLKIGDAEISKIHYNFLINCGTATFVDMLQLLKMIKNMVYEEYQIELIPEWCIIE